MGALPRACLPGLSPGHPRSAAELGQAWVSAGRSLPLHQNPRPPQEEEHKGHATVCRAPRAGAWGRSAVTAQEAEAQAGAGSTRVQDRGALPGLGLCTLKVGGGGGLTQGTFGVFTCSFFLPREMPAGELQVVPPKTTLGFPRAATPHGCLPGQELGSRREVSHLGMCMAPSEEDEHLGAVWGSTFVLLVSSQKCL